MEKKSCNIFLEKLLKKFRKLVEKKITVNFQHFFRSFKDFQYFKYLKNNSPHNMSKYAFLEKN